MADKTFTIVDIERICARLDVPSLAGSMHSDIIMARSDVRLLCNLAYEALRRREDDAQPF